MSLRPFDEKLTKQQIVLKGFGHFEENASAGLNEDGTFGDAIIWPGMGIKINADGLLEPGIRGANMIAIEANLVGMGVDDPYKAGAWVFYYLPQIGDEVLLRVATGQTVTVGDMLANNVTTGLWTVAATGTAAFQAMETIEGALTEDTLVIAKCVPPVPVT